MTAETPPGIGTLNERPLHAALKEWYARPRDRLEIPLDGYVVDILRGDLVIEIQTRSFSGMRGKLESLLERYPVRLVHPVARERWLLKQIPGGGPPRRRKSPRRAGMEALFAELVSFPRLMLHPGFSLEILLIQEEEVRRHEANRAWRRRGWVIQERRLLAVLGRRLFRTPEDLAALIPAEVPRRFTTRDLAEALGRPRRLAQQMAYCLRETEVIQAVGRRDRSILYARSGGVLDVPSA